MFILWVPADLSPDWADAAVESADGRLVPLPPRSSCHHEGVCIVSVPTPTGPVGRLAVAAELLKRERETCWVRFATGVEARVRLLDECQLEQYEPPPRYRRLTGPGGRN